ncbi:MAG: hypothetical protein IH583_01155 [Candidatus Aminicenantes bacterium]|nr:hypothetical protein [Candidatus Aminicenantes bacterium]
MKRAISIVLGLLGIGLIVVLSGSLSRAAGPASWTAVIRPGGNLSGDAWRLDGSLGGWVYGHGEKDVDIYATIGWINSSSRYYRTMFHMKVNDPEKVTFSGIVLTPKTNGSVDDTDPGFPGGNTLFTFINGGRVN